MSAPAPGGKAGALLPAIGGGGTREFATGCVSLGSGRIRSAGGTQDPPCSSLTALLPGAAPHASCRLLLGHVPMVSCVLMCVSAHRHPWAGQGGEGVAWGIPQLGKSRARCRAGKLLLLRLRTVFGQWLDPLLRWGHQSQDRTPGALVSGQNRGKKAHPSKARSATPRSRQITTHISF